MSAPTFAALPAPAVHVARLSCSSRPRHVLDVKIVRETKTMWVDDRGDRWRKSDGALVPQYVEPRYLMTPEAFAAT